MSHPLVGNWTIKSSFNAAAEVLAKQAFLEIAFINGQYEIVSPTSLVPTSWTVENTCVNDTLLAGTIVAGAATYRFVLTLQEQAGQPPKRRLVGMVYGSDFGGGSDPGAWETDEDGPGPLG